MYTALNQTKHTKKSSKFTSSVNKILFLVPYAIITVEKNEEGYLTIK